MYALGALGPHARTNRLQTLGAKSAMFGRSTSKFVLPAEGIIIVLLSVELDGPGHLLRLRASVVVVVVVVVASRLLTSPSTTTTATTKVKLCKLASACIFGFPVPFCLFVASPVVAFFRLLPEQAGGAERNQFRLEATHARTPCSKRLGRWCKGK